MKPMHKILLGAVCLGICANLFLAPSQAETGKVARLSNLSSLGLLGIQDEGRIKPLDTYARTILLQFSGKRTFERKPAINWLAKVLFSPWDTIQDKVFLINSPEIPMAIGIEADPHRRYSYAQLQGGLAKIKKLALTADQIDPKKRSLVDQEVLRVYNNLSLYLKLQSVFSFAVPDQDFTISQASVKTSLDFPVEKVQFSFLDIALKADQINEETKVLEKKKSDAWNANEKELMGLLQGLYKWSINSGVSPLAIMPSINMNDEAWLSPWEMLKVGFSDPEIRKQFALFQDMAIAYDNGQQLDFDIAVKAYNQAAQKRIPDSQKGAMHKIANEVFYNHANPFLYSWFFYLISFFTFLFSLIWPKWNFRKAGFVFLILGFIPHLFALTQRMYIMSRPPVTNLYETFVFVGVVAVLLGIMTEMINKKWLGIVVGSISGFIFLAIADKFSAEGDTMRMLVAVLDSNFWLSTHVLSITIGYSGCCVAGILGHVYIVQALFRPKDKEMLSNTYKHILGILGFGLTMAFLGTMLGGIWADQSWGRFWGWDPKENGALLIVLWTAIIFHAKSAKLLQPLGVAVGAALGVVVVMWAWFGVNLLSIGLHSYGFTSGIATNLTIYVVLEVLFLSVSVIILGKKGMSI